MKERIFIGRFHKPNDVSQYVKKLLKYEGNNGLELYRQADRDKVKNAIRIFFEQNIKYPACKILLILEPENGALDMNASPKDTIKHQGLVDPKLKTYKGKTSGGIAFYSYPIEIVPVTRYEIIQQVKLLIAYYIAKKLSEDKKDTIGEICSRRFNNYSLSPRYNSKTNKVESRGLLEYWLPKFSFRRFSL
ncbi:hypothetical protein MYX76_04035 [Desulfobacterota bacterium AH_259_B03_O07]|nr:hypothetical protein [Desulfobacterota bacterium AH_259_B03_O07]